MSPHGGFTQTLVGIKLSTFYEDFIIIDICSVVKPTTCGLVRMDKPNIRYIFLNFMGVQQQ